MKVWLKAHNINKFVLCGHSMGAYLATKYAAENAKDVLSLILLAPAGVWPQPLGFDPKANPWNEANGLLPRMVYKTILLYWKEKKSPYALCRISGRLAFYALRKYVNTFKNLAASVLPFSFNTL